MQAADHPLRLPPFSRETLCAERTCGRLMLALSPTLQWLMRAAEDPVARHPKHLPETLDFREYAPLFVQTLRAAPVGVLVGVEHLDQFRHRVRADAGQGVGDRVVVDADIGAAADAGYLAIRIQPGLLAVEPGVAPAIVA